MFTSPLEERSQYKTQADAGLRYSRLLLSMERGQKWAGALGFFCVSLCFCSPSPLYLREKCRQDTINQKWETFSNSEAEGTAGGRPIYGGAAGVSARTCVGDVCACISERAIRGRGDRHCGGVKLSAASLMETRHALNMNPSLSLFFLLKVLPLSWPLPSLCPLTSVPLKYLRWTRWCVCVSGHGVGCDGKTKESF